MPQCYYVRISCYIRSDNITTLVRSYYEDIDHVYRGSVGDESVGEGKGVRGGGEGRG